MSEVKVAHLSIVVSGLSEEVHNTTPRDTDVAGRWRFKVEEAVLSYEWDRTVNYWRIVQTTVTGRTISKIPSPGIFTWARGDGGKPDWVVLLENQHYPTRQIHRTNKII